MNGIRITVALVLLVGGFMVGLLGISNLTSSGAPEGGDQPRQEMDLVKEIDVPFKRFIDPETSFYIHNRNDQTVALFLIATLLAVPGLVMVKTGLDKAAEKPYQPVIPESHGQDKQSGATSTTKAGVSQSGGQKAAQGGGQQGGNGGTSSIPEPEAKPLNLETGEKDAKDPMV